MLGRYGAWGGHAARELSRLQNSYTDGGCEEGLRLNFNERAEPFLEALLLRQAGLQVQKAGVVGWGGLRDGRRLSGGPSESAARGWP